VPTHRKSKILPATLALLLLALCIPQTVDSTLWLMTSDTSDQLGKESPALPEEAESNAALLENADTWTDDPKARIRAGILRLRLATASSDRIDKIQLQIAIDDLTDGLARSPANAYAWATLAQAQIASGESAKAKRALATSILIDDFDPNMSLWRCELGLLLWGSFDNDDRRLWNDQVRLAWNTQPEGLVKLARQDDGAYAMPIRLALITDPAGYQAFQQALIEQH
jgi:hypothetical protein